ncbi:uncharacterized protein LOC105381071 isoform X3 [Plutella xylostella]|uniref:uncharacterized protein LOC105381071 isoform X3 n=1 Tax=Plutella xylostella TaxID=51655 RepID=UPI0020331B21|nr:uncharacterized protein LOC105381071 isoform X3 [Plutella xylostella]
MAPVFEDPPAETNLPGNQISSSSLAYVIVMGTLAGMALVVVFLKLITLGQKTRDQQQRRMYVGSMARNPSLGAQTPTIYVSPANLPPPPKYEAMAPPSYEEVVGIHYPNYQPTVQGIAAQPIIQPITTAVAQSANASSTNNVAASSTTANESEPTTVVTVTTDASRTSVTVASA